MQRIKALRPHRIGVQVQTPDDKRIATLRNRGRKNIRAYRVANGLCEICLADGHYKWADHVHHLDQIADIARRFGSISALSAMAHQQDKLLSVCKDCHKSIHAGQVDAELIVKIKSGSEGDRGSNVEQ